MGKLVGNLNGKQVKYTLSLNSEVTGTLTFTAVSGNGTKVVKTFEASGGGIDIPSSGGGGSDGCSSCSGECRGRCGATCREKCNTSCGTSCQKACSVGCSSYCIDSCNYSCSDGCKGSCVDDCSGGCRGSCKDGCLGGCKGTSKSGGGCFIPSTLITLSNKQTIPIFKITKGMELIAYDEVQKIFSTTVVTDIMKFNKGDIVDIILSNGNKVTTTQSHPFLTKEGWKAIDVIMGRWEHNIEVQELHIGDFILTENNEFIEVINIIDRKDLDNTEVYNIDVTNYSTYLANGFVAHNADKKET